MRRVEFDQTSSLGRLLTSGVAPEVMPRHKREFQVFRYSEPQLSPGKTKAITRLCTTDLTYGAMQKMIDGGGSAMHYHAAMDGFWMVIKGEVLLFTDEARESSITCFLLDGVMKVPRGTPYQFYQTGLWSPLVLLQVEGLNAKGHAQYDEAGRGGRSGSPDPAEGAFRRSSCSMRWRRSSNVARRARR